MGTDQVDRSSNRGLTIPKPKVLVLNAQSPQLVYTVLVVVYEEKVQSVSNDGALRRVRVQVGAGAT